MPQHRPRHAAHSGDSQLRLVWVYPDLLSTYGDRGNLLVLQRRAQLRGVGVEAVEVNSDEAVPQQGDIYLLGGGEDLPQILAARRLNADGGLAAAADHGAVIFAVCAGYQVIGTQFGGVEGEPVRGLEILDISSGRGDRRGVGEIVADVDPELGVDRLTGFENHQGITSIGPGARHAGRRQRRRHGGRLRGHGARHLPARPGARAQSEPGRPAAQLGSGPATPAERGRRGLGATAARRAPRRDGQ